MTMCFSSAAATAARWDPLDGDVSHYRRTAGATNQTCQVRAFVAGSQHCRVCRPADQQRWHCCHRIAPTDDQ